MDRCVNGWNDGGEDGEVDIDRCVERLDGERLQMGGKWGMVDGVLCT